MGWDWDQAIKRQADALLALLAMLFRGLGLDEGEIMERITSGQRRRVLRILQPAESAARRLIVAAARGLAVKPLPAARPAGVKPRGGIAKAGSSSGTSIPSFQLHDPRKSFKPRRQRRKPFVLPTISIMGYDAHVLGFSAAPPAPAASPPEDDDDGLITGLALSRRLQALKAALDDVPKQARRLMRWQARRQQIQKLRPVFATPLRPGLPPGWRRKPVHEVDQILRECESLAAYAMAPDTS
jgi:hypothetical protein